MIRSDLIELINSGQCWAFIGSGPSTSAGAPTWKNLVTELLESLADTDKDFIINLKKFNRAFEQRAYNRCLSVIQDRTGRNFVEDYVRKKLGGLSDPGDIQHLLADWPFAGYITTNYDILIEKALRKSGQTWLSVGNTDKE